jgi:hypothetical protein
MRVKEFVMWLVVLVAFVDATDPLSLFVIAPLSIKVADITAIPLYEPAMSSRSFEVLKNSKALLNPEIKAGPAPVGPSPEIVYADDELGVETKNHVLPVASAGPVVTSRLPLALVITFLPFLAASE